MFPPGGKPAARCDDDQRQRAMAAVAHAALGAQQRADVLVGGNPAHVENKALWKAQARAQGPDALGRYRGVTVPGIDAQVDHVDALWRHAEQPRNVAGRAV